MTVKSHCAHTAFSLANMPMAEQCVSALSAPVVRECKKFASSQMREGAWQGAKRCHQLAIRHEAFRPVQTKHILPRKKLVYTV